MAQMNAAQIQQMDQQLTQLVLSVGEDMTQNIFASTFTPNGSNNTVSVPMRPVGLTRGFIVKAQATIVNSGTTVGTLTPWGAANLLSNFTLTDLDNYQRINTSGMHMNALNTAKEGFPFAAALLSSANDGPVKYGNNYNVMSAPGTIGASGTVSLESYYWVPCAYGKRDLRGALYTGVVNATAFLQQTFNPTPCVAAGDATQAVYSGCGGSYSSATLTIYQNYVDQLPRYTSGPNAGKPMLPPISMRTQYRLAQSSLSSISPNQDFALPFTNFQSFLSALAVFDNGGTLNAGTDVNYWALTAANTLQFFKLDPITQALRSRVRNKVDMPLGSYMFDFREQPINTNQAGNMQLILNAATVNSGAQVLVGWESFADVQSVLGAQSLPAT